jgi:hypothetical protein
MVKSCSGERLKRSILVHILLNKEPSLVAGQSQQLLAGTGILRNPEESRGFRGKERNFCPTRIPAKNSCDSRKKTGIPATSPKPRSCKKFLRKTQEKRDPQESKAAEMGINRKWEQCGYNSLKFFI